MGPRPRRRPDCRSESSVRGPLARSVGTWRCDVSNRRGATRATRRASCDDSGSPRAGVELKRRARGCGVRSRVCRCTQKCARCWEAGAVSRDSLHGEEAHPDLAGADEYFLTLRSWRSWSLRRAARAPPRDIQARGARRDEAARKVTGADSRRARRLRSVRPDAEVQGEMTNS